MHKKFTIIKDGEIIDSLEGIVFDTPTPDETDFPNVFENWEHSISGTFQPEERIMEMEYYYRRGDKYFFRNDEAKCTIETDDKEARKIKRGKYKMRFKLP